MLTTKLKTGVTVLAKPYKGSVSAITYANRTQAQRAAEKVNGTVIQPRLGQVFYVAVPTAS